MNRLTLYLFVFFNLSSVLFGNVAKEGLRQVSLHEKACMKRFFSYLMKWDQAGHALCFESKPICLSGIVLKSEKSSFNRKLCMKGWRAFRKNEHLFPHPNFIISSEIFERPDLNNDWKCLHIYIINKKSLMKFLDEHSSAFQNVLGVDFSLESFLQKLEEGHSLKSLINHDEALFGMLLGFGEESPKAFKERTSRERVPKRTEDYCGVNIKSPKGCKIFPVAFVGNPNSEEVQELCSIYEAELEEIWESYGSTKNRLKWVLEKLCDPA